MATASTSRILRTIPLLIITCLFSFPVYAKYGGGKGTAEDPYLIYTAEQMNAIGAEPNDWDKHFKLMENIDLSNYSGDEFNIIGKCYYESYWILRPFTGIFDGNGKKISNFSYSSTDTNYIGLFGYVGIWGKEAVIKDLGLIDPNVDAGIGDYVGSLVGELNKGIITDCYVEGGNVVGDGNVGGLVGAYGEVVVRGFPDPPFTISNCFSTSRVQGIRHVGGLVGTNYIGRITNSYATGNVSGNENVGGLVGVNGKWGEYINFPPIPGTIINCYSTGLVSGESNVGGLVGLHVAGTVIGCFWDIETSGRLTSDGGLGKTTVEMHTINTFLDSNWDFMDETANGTEDIWWILEGRSYPILRWQYGFAFSPFPQDGFIDVIQPVVLNWLQGGSVLNHDVYFGEDEQAVANATFENQGVYCGRLPVEVTIFDPGKLELDTTYYWRIDEVNDADPNSPWKGNVWSFTTANFIVVDDFESYNDLNVGEPGSRRIYLIWIDGFDNPSTNGSIVGCVGTAPVCWPRVHSGIQSMPLIYDNGVPGNYSEATANIDNLVIGRDWTIEGVGILSLWFHGLLGNAAEPMYVALANDDGTTGVSYHNNPEAARIEKWTEWRIDLQEFADQGVNLTNVDTISIGFGDKNNPQPGGSGHVKFDDIRLYRPDPQKPEP